MIFADIKRTCELLEWRGLRALQLVIWPGFWATLAYRFGNWFTKRNVLLRIPGMILYTLWKLSVEMSWGISISAKAQIGPGLFINHFGCIFIHSDAVIGRNANISQEVTIGVKGNTHGGAPTVGDNVFFGAGAKVLGKIRIGNNAVIGANAVVVKDVEEGWVVGGVPAERIK